MLRADTTKPLSTFFMLLNKGIQSLVLEQRAHIIAAGDEEHIQCQIISDCRVNLVHLLRFP
jgi:hypothetical protein